MNYVGEEVGDVFCSDGVDESFLAVPLEEGEESGGG
jgi:hypothetical protein